MRIPEREEIEKALKPIGSTIESVVRSSWDDFMKISRILPFTHVRTERVYVYDRLVAHARIAFSTDPRVQIIEEHESARFVFNNEVIFRLKKGDHAGMSSNLPTEMSQAYHDHAQELPGLPALPRVEIVYLTNDLRTKLEDIRVVARYRGRFLWRYSLTQPTFVSSGIIVPSGATQGTMDKLWAPKTSTDENKESVEG